MDKVSSGIVNVEVESGQDDCRECENCALSIVLRFYLLGVSELVIVLWMTGLHASCTSYQIAWESWQTAEFQNLLGHVVILMSCCAHAVLTCSQTHLDSWLLRTNCRNMKRTRLWRRIVKSNLLKIQICQAEIPGNSISNLDCEVIPAGCLGCTIRAGNRIASWVTASKYLAPTASSLCSATRDAVTLLAEQRWGIQLFRV